MIDREKSKRQRETERKKERKKFNVSYRLKIRVSTETLSLFREILVSYGKFRKIFGKISVSFGK